MKHFICTVWIFLCLFTVQSQNVGIGTSTPGGRLHISHKATVASPTLRLFDSSAGTGSSILFTKESQGNSFSMVSTIGTIAANNTLDFRTTFNSAMIIKGDGNVGIGTTTPQARLQIGHTSTGISPTLDLLDITGGAGSLLQFSKQGFTANMQIWSGIFGNTASGNSLNIQHSGGSPIVTVMGDGKVGINEENPASALDVGGGINFSGELRSVGDPGNSGEFLMSRGTGLNPVWGIPVSGFTSMLVVNASAGTTNFIVPAGVTKIMFEGWSGGGASGFNNYGSYINYRGGGSGAYFKASLTITPGQSFAIHVPLAQATNNFADKDSLSIQLNPVTGLNDKLVIQNGDSASGGRRIRNTGIWSSAVLYTLDGNEGGISTLDVDFEAPISIGAIQRNFFKYHEASGGNAPNGGHGGRGSYKREIEVLTGNSILDITPGSNGKMPGGGAAISRSAGGTITFTTAGNGLLLIYY